MDKIDEILTRGVTNIIPGKKELEKVLQSKKKLNVYLGIDPTATKIHLGNAVPLRKLQSFVELGHNVTFLIGDFTALIGDTSDKESERPVLTYKEIQENFKTYKEQASKILDFSKVKIRHNSEWLKKLGFEDVVKLCQHFSLGDFISREMIKKRLNSGQKVRYDENLYPVMQGYDSYFMDTDIQIGGADQTFNMQAGRSLQKDLRNKESFVLVTGYLEGTDGRKMSKSWGNAIWLDDNPNDMFGKVMSVRDDLLKTYFTLATNLSGQEIDEVYDPENPMESKKKLAYQIVKELHGQKQSELAEENFERNFQERQPEHNTPIPTMGSLATTVAPFTSLGTVSDAKRLIQQGAVDVSGATVYDPSYSPRVGEEIQIGKKIFGTIVKPKK